jgi:protein-S-isoprenylcysteine O-methyltransferase Ste14
MAVGATTTLAVSLKSVAALPLRQRVRHPLYRQWLRFVIFGRAVPATLFGFMALLQWNRLREAIAAASANPSFSAYAGSVASKALYLAFCSIPVAMYLTRPMPQARDGSLPARAAAFTGTLMQLFVGAFLPVGQQLVDPPAWARDLSSALAVFAFGFAVISLAYLRRNLSIIPEARRLSLAGPYRLVRHPLYFAEITAAIALVSSTPYLTPLVALVVFIVMQNIRAGFEERLLQATFPEYADYARRTRRIIPFVW